MTVLITPSSRPTTRSIAPAIPSSEAEWVMIPAVSIFSFSSFRLAHVGSDLATRALLAVTGDQERGRDADVGGDQREPPPTARAPAPQD